MTIMPITEASRRGISRLVALAKAGDPVVLSRHGKVVAELVSADEMDALRSEKEAMREAALVMARFATDSGERTSLDDAIEKFGFSRAELEAELDAESS